MQRVLFQAATLLAATATLAVAQIKPGHSIHTVTVGGATAGTGEMYDVDHQAQKATKLTIPTVLVNDRPNTVLMTSAVGGYIGTNPVSTAGTTGNIYAFTVLANTVKLLNSGKPLNTSASAGNNLAQMAVVNGRIYFCTQTSSATGGVIQSIPQSGGKVQADLDIGTVQATRLANALTAIGKVVYVATWDVTTAATDGGDLVAYDTVGKKGTLVMKLPKGKFATTTATWGVGVVAMHAHPDMAGMLALCGIYGDLLIVDPDQKNGHKNPKVVSHQFTGGKNSAGNGITNVTNSFYYDPTSKDWVVGTRDGHIDRWVDGHSAEKIIAGVGSNASAANNSVNGSHYFPVTKNHDHTAGAGCAAPPSGYTPTDVAIGAAVSPNPNFKFALFSGSGGARYLLALGLQNKVSGSQILPWRLPGTTCFLRMDPLVILASGTLAGAGAGLGTAVVPVPIPSGVPRGLTLYRQWAMAVTPVSFVLSNAREIKFQ